MASQADIRRVDNQIASTIETNAPRNPLDIGTPNGLSRNLYTNRGTAGRSFEENKYEIENHSYPSDIMSSEYGGNYVVFYINVSIDSKMYKNKEEQFVDNIDPRDRGDLVAKNYSAAELGVATGLIGSGIGSTLGLGGGALGGGLIGGGLGAAAVGAVATQSPGFTRPQKRLKTAIALHIPNTLNISYGMQWEEDSTAGFATAVELGRVLGDTAKAIIDSPTKIATAGTEILNGVKKMGPAATARGLSAIPSAVGAAAGLAPNPKKEQMFRGVDFRTFTFDYQFYPRDSKEAQNVLNIIQAFKYHMHPEFKDDGNFLYIYPSEFDIYYYQGSTENRNIHRHTSCVLTNLNINYTPQGQFTTFDDGMPTQINVTMTFKELALLTKDKIKDGM